MRTATPPVIDGLLDDEVWASAPFIEDLHQFRPLDHVDPSQRTRVYLLYDEANLYVAARLWDSEPDQIRVRALAQGQSVRWDDNFGIYLVPFNNDRTGYNFQANPNGVRSDAVFETPTDLNRDWEGIWTAEGNVDDEGWTIEMVIPFKTLNFDPENPDWGFNAERTIARNQEDIGWVSHNQRINPSATGTVTGLTGLRQGRGLDLVPSIVTVGSKDFDARATDTAVEPSLDVFYNFTPSLTGVLTLNTDFSATEVDDRQINLTRFSLFFPEKREFFLQDVDIFSFGGLERNGIPFFSRRIGLSGTGEPLDIEAGVKLTGRVGRWNVGALGVQQDAFGDVAGKDLLVGRVAANVLEESSVGMIVTDGDPRTNLDNTLVGFDFRYRNTRLPGGRTLEGEAWYQQSDTQGVIEDQRAWGARIASPQQHRTARLAGVRSDRRAVQPCSGVREPHRHRARRGLSRLYLPARAPLAQGDRPRLAPRQLRQDFGGAGEPQLTRHTLRPRVALRRRAESDLRPGAGGPARGVRGIRRGDHPVGRLPVRPVACAVRRRQRAGVRAEFQVRRRRVLQWRAGCRSAGGLAWRPNSRPVLRCRLRVQRHRAARRRIRGAPDRGCAPRSPSTVAGGG